MNDKEIRISARALLELLAGRVDQRSFFEDHGFVPSARRGLPNINYFENFLSRGKLISGARLERSEHQDDDWLVFEFGEKDPAVSPFQTKKEPE